MRAQILSAVTVIDMTEGVAGPYASTLLGDMGARVIKVERREGDWQRSAGKGGAPGVGGAQFIALNRNKRDIGVDLGTADGRRIVERLVAKADVVVSNYRAGVMAKLGFDYARCKALRADIIYCSISGFGQDGPYGHRAGVDQIAQGMGGLMSITGEPGKGPMRVGIPVADLSAGIFCAMGVLLALIEREQSGIGQKVEVSLLGTQLALQAPEVLHYLHFGQEHERDFRASPTVGHYRCADERWIMIVGIDQKFWPRIATALEVRELVDDPRFARGYARYVNRDELQRLLEEAFASNGSAHWLDRLRDADVPAALVFDYAEMSKQDQPWANGYLVNQEHPRFGTQRVVGLHIQLSETPGEVSAPAPELGADTDAVLRWAGLIED